METKALTVDYELSKDAHKALQEIAAESELFDLRWRWPWQRTIWCAIALIAIGTYGQSEFTFATMGWRLLQALIIGAYFLPLFFFKVFNRLMDKAPALSLSGRLGDPTLVGKHRITITESYIEECSAGYLNRIHWSAISGIQFIEPLFIFDQDANSSVILPMFAFERAMDCQQLYGASCHLLATRQKQSASLGGSLQR